MEYRIRINRIRLEFKVFCFTSINLSFNVLIESDWNLKSLRRASFLFFFGVLIESDWNLKTIPH